MLARLSFTFIDSISLFNILTVCLCDTLRKILSMEAANEYSLSAEPKQRFLHYDTVSDFYFWQILTYVFFCKEVLNG